MDVTRPSWTDVVGRWGLASVLAGTLTFAIDRAWAAASVRSAIRWRWIHELTSWGGHVVLALVLVAIALAAGATKRVLPPRMRDRWVGQIGLPTATCCVVIGPPLVRIGNALASGPWVAAQWFAPLLTWTPVGSLLVAVPLAHALSRDHGPQRVWWRRALTLVVAAGLAVLVVVDHAVAPGLYPGFHQLAEAAAAGSAVVLVMRVLPSFVRRGRLRTSQLEVAVALAAITSAALSWFASSNATRGALLLRSHFARLWIPASLPAARSTILRRILAEPDMNTTLGSATSQGAQPAKFDGRGDWNVVLVVVDTMRADAVPPARPPGGLPFAQPGDTPNIDAWIENAYRFETAYSPATETKRAMPAMLRSIEASEDPLIGVPIAERMAALELVPLAVVHRYFRPARYAHVGALLDGYVRVIAYDDSETATAVPIALDLLAAAAPQRFFLFLHLYGLHRPGFDGDVVSPRVPRVEAYRRSLVYLDGQFAALLDGLASRGLRERTIVVLTSDHGEGLGDHEAILHGPSVFDEDVRVPLAFEIPGRQGHAIHETVGTIDLVPTLVDLLGAPRIVNVRGRSLLPLFEEEPVEPKRPYFFENWDDTRSGLVSGRDKIIYERALGLAYRFDLERDPDEYDDLHDVDVARRQLLRRLIELEPSLAGDELEDAETRQLLLERLRKVDPGDTSPELDFLVQLVGLAPTPELLTRCAEIFEQAGVDVRVLLARHLLTPAPSPMVELMTQWLATLEGDPNESLVIDALARQHVPAFALDVIARRMTTEADRGTTSSWEPWLRLIRYWPKPEEHFAEPLHRMKRRLLRERATPRSVAQLLRENIAAMERLAR